MPPSIAECTAAQDAYSHSRLIMEQDLRAYRVAVEYTRRRALAYTFVKAAGSSRLYYCRPPADYYSAAPGHIIIIRHIRAHTASRSPYMPQHLFELMMPEHFATIIGGSMDASRANEVISAP